MRNKNILPVFMAALLTVAAPLSVYGDVGPGQAQNTIPEGVTQEQWDRLNDQTIEFEELSDLVRYFNPDYQNTAASLIVNVDNIEYIYKEMRGYIKDLEDDAQALKDSDEINTKDGIEKYMMLSGTAKGLKSQAEKTQRSLKQIKQSNSSINFNLTHISRQFEYYADQVMIGYNSAAANQALLQKVVELSNAAYEAQELGKRIGTATEGDVLSAKKELLSAQSSLLSLTHTVDGLQRSLGLMTGYSADSKPVIGGLPQLDMQEVSSLDLEGDTAKAINNNYNVIDLRRGSSGKTTKGMENKQTSVSEAEQGVAISMQSFYQQIKQAKTAYDAACTSYEKATLDKGKAERAFQMGMLSKIAYLQSQMAYLQAEGEKQSAYNTLFQAYDAYQWAIKGIIMDSEQ
ncbi:TolC family protein [Clostridium sp. HBUAS56010]|uniref:TolC family protein n=1 Tax=Clostridium sp. HBUAS56010 TaxID=2571127 RepID=UPI0011786A03|nr:TolC family protein [Clostridium sp. HBUAS56010]